MSGKVKVGARVSTRAKPVRFGVVRQADTAAKNTWLVLLDGTALPTTFKSLQLKVEEATAGMSPAGALLVPAGMQGLAAAAEGENLGGAMGESDSSDSSDGEVEDDRDPHLQRRVETQERLKKLTGEVVKVSR